MNKSNRIVLITAFLVVILLFLAFGYGAMSGSFMGRGMMGGGRMMGDGTMGQYGYGGYPWMWIPAVIALGIGIFFGWLLFGKKWQQNVEETSNQTGENDESL